MAVERIKIFSMAEETTENTQPPADWVKPEPDGYYWQTQRPLNCLVFLLPAMIYFHVCTLIWGNHLMAPDFISRAMNFWGRPTTLVPGVVLITVLLFQQAIHRFRWTVNGWALAGMLAESVLWNLLLVAMSYLTVRAVPASAGLGGEDGILAQLAQACGAGIYEEFAFRLIVISLILLLMVDLLKLPRGRSVVVAIVLSAIAFGVCHFLGSGTPFHWSRFIFLVTGGLLWGGLYVFRGFGIAAGGHMVWDIYCVLSN